MKEGEFRAQAVNLDHQLICTMQCLTHGQALYCREECTLKHCINQSSLCVLWDEILGCRAVPKEKSQLKTCLEKEVF